jgi:type II secretory pathway pseudopilin PulG
MSEGESVGLVLGMQLVILLVTGAIAAAIASSKGRSVVGWFFGGFFLGIIGIVIVAVLPNLKEQREKERYVERENRRLREQLRQERLKQEAFRQHTAARLDVHDDHLGLDTRTANQPLLTSEPQNAGQVASDPSAALEQMSADEPAHWYYEMNGQAIGPTTADNIRMLLDNGRLNDWTLVWTERLSDWAQADSLPEFRTDTT